MPVLGFDAFRKPIERSWPHVHEECLEISLCLRGDLKFELRGKTYPFKPHLLLCGLFGMVACVVVALAASGLSRVCKTPRAS